MSQLPLHGKMVQKDDIFNKWLWLIEYPYGENNESWSLENNSKVNYNSQMEMAQESF